MRFIWIDYEAVHAWLSLHEAASTQRSYRKEAEHLILWAIVERGKALSSLTTEDAIQYRAFLRRPPSRARWVGLPCSRTSPDWWPFTGELSARSAAHALSVLGAMFRWLIEQRYVLANAFAGVKVRGTRPCAMDTGRAFSDGEWSLLRTVADGLKWSYHWEEAAAQRLRFVLNFAYATGLRAEELVSAKLGQTEVDDHGDQWLKVVGKGAKAGKVRCRPWRGRRSTATWPAGDAGEVEAGHTRRRQPQRRGCDHGNTLVEHLQVVLRHCRHRRRRAQPGDGRQAAPGHSSLDAPHPRDARPGRRRRAEVGTRQPEACVDRHHVGLCTATMCGGRSRWQGCSACERSSALACWSRYTRSGVTVYNEMCRPLPRRLDDRIQRSLVGAEAHQFAQTVRPDILRAWLPSGHWVLQGRMAPQGRVRPAKGLSGTRRSTIRTAWWKQSGRLALVPACSRRP